MRAPRPLWATASGTALARPPAPTSWMSAIGLSSPAAQQRSITSCARRCISALPRCTEAKSRSALELPLPTEEAAPPPSPMSMAGQPSTTSFAPQGARGERDDQARLRDAGEAGLGFGAATGGALVADRPARAGGGAGEGRDGGGMIVRHHLHENVDRLGAGAVDTAVRVGEIARPGGAGDDRGVVAVGGQHARGIALVGVADHREQ